MTDSSFVTPVKIPSKKSMLLIPNYLDIKHKDFTFHMISVTKDCICEVLITALLKLNILLFLNKYTSV